MLILKKSKQYFIMKKLGIQLKRITDLESRIMDGFFKFVLMLLGLLSLSLFTFIFFFDFDVISIVINISSFFLAIFLFSKSLRFDRVLELKVEATERLDRALKHDLRFDDDIDLYFNQLMELKKQGRLKELEKDVVKEILHNKKQQDSLPELTNDEIVDGFIEQELKKEYKSEIIND